MWTFWHKCRYTMQLLVSLYALTRSPQWSCILHFHQPASKVITNITKNHKVIWEENASSECTKKSNTNQWTSTPSKTLLLHEGCEPHLTHRSSSRPYLSPQMAAQLLHMLLHSYAINSLFITMDRPIPNPKLPFPDSGSRPHLTYGSCGRPTHHAKWYLDPPNSFPQYSTLKNRMDMLTGTWLVTTDCLHSIWQGEVA